MTFDFSLSTADEDRAQRLHRESIVFDWLSQYIGGPNIFDAYPEDLKSELHRLVTKGGGWQTVVDVMLWPYQLSLAGRSHLVRDWSLASGMTCGSYQVSVHDGTVPVMVELDATFERLRALPWLRFVTTAAEIRQAKRDGVVAWYGNCQPLVPAPRNLAAFDAAYRRGMRSYMLTYNRMDHVGVGCTERVDAGLSRFGVDVVRHCESLGVIVDTSHCGYLTTMDACKVAKRPVNANHTCAKALSSVARAKPDDALRAIADTGGVIGVVMVPFFLSTDRRPTLDRFLDHVDYLANLVGWRHVSLGTDWPLQLTDDLHQKMIMAEAVEIGFRPEDRVDASDRLLGFRDYRDLPNVTRGLVKRGYSDEQVRGILGENALRVFEAVCG